MECITVEVMIAGILWQVSATVWIITSVLLPKLLFDADKGECGSGDRGKITGKDYY